MTDIAPEALSRNAENGVWNLFDANLNRVLTDEDFAHAGVTASEVGTALDSGHYKFHSLGEPGNWDRRDVVRAGTLDFPVRGVTIELATVRTWIDTEWKKRKEAEAEAKAEAEAYDAAMEDIRILMTQGVDNDGVTVSRAQCAKILRGLRVPAF